MTASADPSVNAIDVLKKLPILKGLSHGDYLKILTLCSSNPLNDGQVLFREGDEGASLYVILSGEITIMIEGRGLVQSLESGETVGEMALVTNMERTATAIAAKSTLLLELHPKMLYDLFDQNPRIGYITMKNIASILAERLTKETKKQ